MTAFFDFNINYFKNENFMCYNLTNSYYACIEFMFKNTVIFFYK